MNNRYIQSIYGMHLLMAGRYNSWASLINTAGEHQQIQNELEATAQILAENMNFDGIPRQGEVQLKVNRDQIRALVTKKLNRGISVQTLDDRILEVRDDVMAFDPSFSGYLFRR